MIKYVAALIAAVLALAACAPVDTAIEPEKPGSSAARSETGAGSSSGGGSDSKVAEIGEWARAEDGLRFRVSKLTRGTVGQYAAGGERGGPAVIVTIQFNNDGKRRFDMTLVDVKVRAGKDGADADEVFDGQYGDPFEGTLNPGRTATKKMMFGVERASDLKDVSVEITPGFEYSSFTFEGSV